MRNHLTQNILFFTRNVDEFTNTAKTFRENGLANKLIHFEKEDKLIEYFDNTINNYYNYPCVILFDLDSKKESIIDLIKYFSKNEMSKNILVIILIDSKRQKVSYNSFKKYGANLFLQKPLTVKEYIKGLMLLENFLIELKIFPKT